MLHDWWQRQLSWTRAVIFRRYDTLLMSNNRRRWPGNPNGRSKFRNLRLFTLTRSQLTLRWRLSDWRRLPEIAQTARCRHRTHRWRWPGNPNGRSKFRNLRLFTWTRSQLTLRRQLRGWWRLSEIAQTAPCRRQTYRRWLPHRSKFRNNENLCLWDQEKPLEEHLFAVGTPPLWWQCTLFFLLSLATTFVLTYEK